MEVERLSNVLNASPEHYRSVTASVARWHETTSDIPPVLSAAATSNTSDIADAVGAVASLLSLVYPTLVGTSLDVSVRYVSTFFSTFRAVSRDWLFPRIRYCHGKFHFDYFSYTIFRLNFGGDLRVELCAIAFLISSMICIAAFTLTFPVVALVLCLLSFSIYCLFLSLRSTPLELC